MIVVAIIALLGAVAVANLVRAREQAQEEACFANLDQIENAKDQWALENSRSTGDGVVATEVNGYLRGSQAPVWPGGGSYTYNAVGAEANCSQHYAAAVGGGPAGGRRQNQGKGKAKGKTKG